MLIFPQYSARSCSQRTRHHFGVGWNTLRYRILDCEFSDIQRHYIPRNILLACGLYPHILIPIPGAQSLLCRYLQLTSYWHTPIIINLHYLHPFIKTLGILHGFSDSIKFRSFLFLISRKSSNAGFGTNNSNTC